MPTEDKTAFIKILKGLVHTRVEEIAPPPPPRSECVFKYENNCVLGNQVLVTGKSGPDVPRGHYTTYCKNLKGEAIHWRRNHSLSSMTMEAQMSDPILKWVLPWWRYVLEYPAQLSPGELPLDSPTVCAAHLYPNGNTPDGHHYPVVVTPDSDDLFAPSPAKLSNAVTPYRTASASTSRSFVVKKDPATASSTCSTVVKKAGPPPTNPSSPLINRTTRKVPRATPYVRPTAIKDQVKSSSPLKGPVTRARGKAVKKRTGKLTTAASSGDSSKVSADSSTEVATSSKSKGEASFPVGPDGLVPRLSDPVDHDRDVNVRLIVTDGTDFTLKLFARESGRFCLGDWYNQLRNFPIDLFGKLSRCIGKDWVPAEWHERFLVLPGDTLDFKVSAKRGDCIESQLGAIHRSKGKSKAGQEVIDVSD